MTRAVTSSEPTTSESCGDRPGVIAPRCGREPEDDPGAGRRRDVGGRFGVGQKLAHRLGVGLPVEPQPELLLGEAQLAELRARRAPTRSRGTRA